MDANGKTAVVTGGSRGIGRGISLKLAEAGADIAILYRKRHEPAQKIKAEITGLGRRVEVYHCDVSDQDRVTQVFDRIKESFGRIDILVNNAGLASWANFIHDTTFAEWDKIMKSNIYGPYNCIREALPAMRAQGLGHIINISSTMTKGYMQNGGPYGVAKAGLDALTQILAHEETKNFIRVNAINPGMVETDMGRGMVKGGDLKPLYPKMPFARACQPEDIAGLVLFLVSEEGSYIQGQCIHINGGPGGGLSLL
ncbi:MAG: SDR family oxidoreductase [Thermodesulfobacteriota bacterium]|nr:SDR family oxidoreductase [Thermodesulfobacteriota bacterium]